MQQDLVDALSKEELLDILHARYNVVCQLDLRGNLLNYYLSLQDAENKTGISNESISFSVTGKRQHSGGYQWCYYRDLNKKINNVVFNTNGSKAVVKMNNNNECLEIYPSAKIAGKRNNCDTSTIGKVCKGKRKTCGGYKWRYAKVCDIV